VSGLSRTFIVGAIALTRIGAISLTFVGAIPLTRVGATD
jgi:hypothetical protein